VVLLVGEVQGEAALVVRWAGSLSALRRGHVIRAEGPQQGPDDGRGEEAVLMLVGVVSGEVGLIVQQAGSLSMFPHVF
jgi:hypothetical protein